MIARRFVFLLLASAIACVATVSEAGHSHFIMHRRPSHLRRAEAVHSNVTAPYHAGRQGNARTGTFDFTAHDSSGKANALGRPVLSSSEDDSTSDSDSGSDSDLTPNYDKRGGQPYRGVNLGGWLVLESWMSPSVMSQFGDSRVVDEWTLGQYVDHDTAERIMQAHWDNWVQEDDFKQMCQAGLNFVRIPVGYWIWDKDSANEPYLISNQTAYLNRAVRWAKKYGLKVMIDLHGVPGSQNGFDTAGHIKDTFNFHDSPQNAKRAVAVLKQVAQDYSQSEFKDTVTMIEVINEPLCDQSEELLDYVVKYYHQAYNAIREAAGNQMKIVLADGFVPLSRWNKLLANTSWTNVMIDTHVYLQYYNANLGRKARTPYTQQDVHAELCKYRNLLNKSKYPVLVGEFSMSMPSCPDCWSKPLPTYNFLQSAFQTSASAFESATAGWSLWAWRIEGNAPGSYENGVQSGWITKQLGKYNLAKC